jgi:hypothetical protein
MEEIKPKFVILVYQVDNDGAIQFEFMIWYCDNMGSHRE